MPSVPATSPANGSTDGPASDHRSPAWSRRRLLSTGAAAVAGGLAAPALIGCSGEDSAAAIPGSGSTTLTFACAAFAGSSGGMQQFVNTYNTAQDRYRVVVRDLPPPSSSSESHQQLVQQLARQDGTIDVFAQDIIWIAEMADAGWVQPLDAEFNAEDRKAFLPGVVEGCTYQGRFVALPWYVDAGGLYYRTDLLRRAGVRPPRTWEELVDVAATAREAPGANGVDMGFVWQAKQAEILICNVVEFLASAGGAIIDPDSTVRIAESEAVDAIAFMGDLIHRHHVSPSEVFSWDEEPSRRPFSAGQAALMRHWAYAYGVCQDPEQSEVVDKIDVAPLPAFAGGESASCLGGYQLGVSAACRNKDGAFDFLRWLTSHEVQVEFAAEFGNGPARRSTFSDPKLEKTQPAMVAMEPAFNNGVPRPVTPDYPRVSLALQSAISRALVDGDVRATLRRAKSRLEEIVHA